MLMIAYSGGLRVSEIVNLEITDIDSDRNQIRIGQGKGVRSIQQILKDSIAKAGITKKVSMHN